MRAIKSTILIAMLLSSVSCPSRADNTTVYPPTNQAAGSGLLYFPAGGESSLYAVPVISDDLTAAVKELKDAVSKSSGIQCTGVTNGVFCVNAVTGKVCSYSAAGGGSPSWWCVSPSNYNP